MAAFIFPFAPKLREPYFGLRAFPPLKQKTRPVISFGGARNHTTTHCHAARIFLVAGLRKQFGQHLRQIRAERRMTQEQFAEVLEISVDFLSLIERGINAPSFENLERMAKKLRMTVAELFSFD